MLQSSKKKGRKNNYKNHHQNQPKQARQNPLKNRRDGWKRGKEEKGHKQKKTNEI